MKKYLFFLLVIALQSCVATYPFSTGFPNPNFEKIVETTHDKDNAFVIANSWLVEQMVDAKDVIQYSDKEAGVIKGKFMFYYSRTVSGYSTGLVKVEGLITIKVKDNKSMIQIDISGEKNVTLLGDYDTWTEKEFASYKAKIDFILADFERVMTEKVDTDW
jgi:hypothetical protein